MDLRGVIAHAWAVTVHIALLRGVNVGGHGKVAMVDLRAMLGELGFAEARSILNSGNLVFRGKGRGGRVLEERLERAAAERLDLHTDFMVRTAAEWAEIIAANPYPDAAADDPSHLLAMVMKEAPSEGALDALRAAIRGNELVDLAGTTAYIIFPDGIGRSKLTTARIESKLGARGTARNWNTVLKLAELAAAPGQ